MSLLQNSLLLKAKNEKLSCHSNFKEIIIALLPDKLQNIIFSHFPRFIFP